VQFERLKAIQFAKKHLMLAGKFTIATEYCTQALRDAMFANQAVARMDRNAGARK